MPNTDRRLTVIVSNAADGTLATYLLDAEGQLAPLGLHAAGDVVMPLARPADGTRLYAATRGAQPAIVAFDVAPRTAALTRVASATIDANLAYLTLDGSGRWLLGASYGGHTLSVYDAARVRAGDGVPLQVIGGIPNAHAVIVSPDDRYAYVSSLGSDRIFCFELVHDMRGIRAVEHGEARVERGFGPRHLRLTRDGRTLVAVGEFEAKLAVFARDPDSGRLGDAHTTPRPAVFASLAAGHARPPAPAEPAVWAADLQLTPDERFAYVSERTTSQLACYRRHADGTFAAVHATATEAQPRGFAIDPSGRFLVACGEQSEYVSVYAIAPDDGALTPRARVSGGRGANWVEIV